MLPDIRQNIIVNWLVEWADSNTWNQANAHLILCYYQKCHFFWKVDHIWLLQMLENLYFMAILYERILDTS